MTNFPVDYLRVELQENIPLSDEELQYLDKKQRAFFKDTPGILAACTLLILAIAYYFVQNEIAKFQYYHYILFVFAGFALFGFFYLIIWLTYKYFKKRWKKDIAHGKSKLWSVIIDRHKTENDEYIITFAGRNKNEKIRIPVKKVDYYNYPIGTKVCVTYLKYSNEAFELLKL
jgi:hypothetical protein